MASGIHGAVAADLERVIEAIPEPEEARPIQCVSAGCDWQGTTAQLIERKRQGRVIGRDHESGRMIHAPIIGLHCPECGIWNRGS